MGLFTSKEDRILDYFEATYRRSLASLYGLRVSQGYGVPFFFRSSHGNAIRWAMKETQDKYRVRIDSSQFDRPYLEMSCAEYGFNVLEVLNARDPMLKGKGAPS
jgi:hypothetical protein